MARTRMRLRRMWCLTIRIKRKDEVADGTRLSKILIELLMDAGVSGATLWIGTDGYGKRGKSSIQIEGTSSNMPMMIDVIDLKSKLEPLLPEIKRTVGDNGIISIQNVDVL